MTNYDFSDQYKARINGKVLANKHLDMVRDALKDITQKVERKKINHLKKLHTTDKTGVIISLGNI